MMSQGALTEQRVTFLNIDLDLYGDFDRNTVLSAMGERVFVLHDEPGRLSVELAWDGDMAFDSVVGGMQELVASLSGEARMVWNSAARRVLDVGIQSGLGPYATHYALSSSVLDTLARTNVELVFTVYGAELDSSNT